MRDTKSIVLGIAAAMLVALGGARMTWGMADSYKRISMNEYQNFLGNWDDRAEPVLYALIRTPGEYDLLFHPAAIGGVNRPFHPEAGLYRQSMILVAGRTCAMPPGADLSNSDRLFEVEGVTTENGELTLRYRWKTPKAGKQDAKFKVYLALRVAKADYRKVTIVENGKVVGQLKPAEGRWAVPTPAPE